MTLACFFNLFHLCATYKLFTVLQQRFISRLVTWHLSLTKPQYPDGLNNLHGRIGYHVVLVQSLLGSHNEYACIALQHE